MTTAKNFVRAGGVFLPAFLVFSAVSILTSLWAGYVWRNTAAILLFSIAITFILVRHFKPRMPLTKGALLIAVLAFAMAAYPFIFITPFYQASADPAYLITIRAIQDHIPETYAPYSDLKFSYQIGHALFARLFVDVLAPMGIPDYVVQWLLGSLLVALEALLVFSFGSKIFRSDATGELAALLYLGSRPVFLNVYWGAHPMILGMLFVLFSIILFHERNRLAYLFAPLAFVSHPAAALSGMLFLVAYLLFNHSRTRDALWFLPALLLALPSFLTTYAVLASNVLSPVAEAAAVQPLAAQSVWDTFYFLPLWVGLLPSLLLALSLIVLVLRKQKLGREQAMLLTATVLLFVAYLLCSLMSLGATAPRITSMVAICSVIFSASVLMPVLQKHGKGALPPKPSRAMLFKALVLLLALALFLNSSMLNELRTGTQITPEEADAAFALLRYDPGLKPALFLSPGRLKMAEFSNKIPYNPVGELFLPTSPYQAVQDAAWAELLERDEKWKEVCGCDYFRAETITRTGDLCIECIPELGVEYAVVNRNYFPEELPWQLVLSSGSIDVYSIAADNTKTE